MDEFTIIDFSSKEVALASIHLANYNCKGKNDSNKVFSWFYRVMKSIDSSVKKIKKEKMQHQIYYCWDQK